MPLKILLRVEALQVRHSFNTPDNDRSGQSRRFSENLTEIIP